jgi:secreted trypsin-like serine protease
MGTLVDRTTVLTVAHCIISNFTLMDSQGNSYTFQVTTNSYSPSVGGMYTVYVAEYNLDYYDQSPAQSYSVKTAFRHASYDSTNVLNDIGMIKLNAQVSLNKYVQIACLPSRTVSYYPTGVNSSAYVAGWGDMYDNGTYAWLLQNAKITVYDNSLCNNVMTNVT